MRIARAVFVTLGLAALIGLAWVTPSGAANQSAEIRNNTFNPPDITVNVGDTVAWHNYDAETHSVVGGPINSPDIAPNGDFSWKFTSAGDVSYTCRFHPYMSGVVHVTSSGGSAAPAPAASPSPSPSPSQSPATTVAPSPNEGEDPGPAVDDDEDGDVDDSPTPAVASESRAAASATSPTATPSASASGAIPAARFAFAGEPLEQSLVGESTPDSLPTLTASPPAAPSATSTTVAGVAASALQLANQSSGSAAALLLAAIVLAVLVVVTSIGVRSSRRTM